MCVVVVALSAGMFILEFVFNSSSEKYKEKSLVMNKETTLQKGTVKLQLLLLIIPIAVFVQLILLPRLPQKYFYDSSYILSIFLGQRAGAGGWAFTANFFKLLDWFHFTTLSEWSFLLSSIFTLYLLISLMKQPAFTVPDYLLVFCVTALLNIYVFRMSKELLQYIIFILAAGFIRSRLEYKIKVFIIGVLLAAEGAWFRSYFYLICVLFLFFCFLLNLKAVANKRRLIVLFSISCIAGLFALKYISYENYMQLITIRDYLTISRIDNADANTLIVNLFTTNGSLLLFIANYIINLFRILFPLELIGKGAFYLAFVFFQLLVTAKIIVVCVGEKEALFSPSDGINQENRLQIGFCFIAAYYLVSIIFEPDFGSFIRHETAFCPILFDFFLLKSAKIPAVSISRALPSRYIKDRSKQFIRSPI